MHSTGRAGQPVPMCFGLPELCSLSERPGAPGFQRARLVNTYEQDHFLIVYGCRSNYSQLGLKNSLEYYMK
jgi:hypothetical protein